MLSAAIIDPHAADIIDSVCVHACVCLSESVCVCVIASQSTEKPSVVTLPPSVRDKEVHLLLITPLNLILRRQNAVITIKQMKTASAIQSS